MSDIRERQKPELSLESFNLVFLSRLRSSLLLSGGFAPNTIQRIIVNCALNTFGV